MISVFDIRWTDGEGRVGGKGKWFGYDSGGQYVGSVLKLKGKWAAELVRYTNLGLGLYETQEEAMAAVKGAHCHAKYLSIVREQQEREERGRLNVKKEQEQEERERLEALAVLDEMARQRDNTH